MVNQTQAKIWWYGKKAKDGIKISHYSQNLKGAKFRLHYQSQKATVSWKVIGEHQLLSAYAAATVGIICGLTLKQVAKGLSQVKPPNHRLNSIITKHINIIDDTYNASPKAAIKSLKTLISLGKGKKKIAVLGEMKDLGSLSKDAHKNVGEKIARSKINYLITIGKTASMIGHAAKKASFKGKIINVDNTSEAIKELKKIINSKTLVLIKGSRHAHLERIVQGLLHKSTQVVCYHCGELK
jgi:UDP-N-acetylmuramoyl-tripeptide--D-alanyl-D-alanine ligase